MHTVSDRIIEICDCLIVCCSAFLTDAEREKNKDRLDINLSGDQRTEVIANLFKGITEKYLHFTKKYQANKRQMHDLHSDLFNLIKELHAVFLNPEKIPSCSATKLLGLELKRDIQLNDRDLAVDKVSKCLKDGWEISSFLKACREGHVSIGKEYLKKLQ